MRANTHRYTICETTYLGDENEYIDKKYYTNQSYQDSHPDQKVSGFILNRLNRGNGEAERSGHSVYALELRVKLVLRSWDAAWQTTANSNNLLSTFTGVQSNQFKTIRNYYLRLNQAGVTVGSHSVVGTVDGVAVGVDTQAVALEAASASVTSSTESGNVEIVDSHPNDRPSYIGTTANEAILPRNANFSTFYAPPQMVRILILKWFDVVIPEVQDESTTMDFFIENPIIYEDFYGPINVEELPDAGDIKVKTGSCFISVRPLTSPLLERVYKKCDILYDKIVTFTPEKPFFNLDEVWKLNDTCSWIDDHHMPVNNGIGLYIYDLPGSYKAGQLESEVSGYRFTPNIFHVDICSEYYYNQPN